MAMTFVDPTENQELSLDTTCTFALTGCQNTAGPIFIWIIDGDDQKVHIGDCVGFDTDPSGASFHSLGDYGYTLVAGPATMRAYKMQPPGLIVVLETVSIPIILVSGLSVSLGADDTDVSPNAPVLLSWSSSDDATAVVSSNFGATAVNGSTTVYPTVTTVYTITVKDAGDNDVTDTVEVTVTEPETPTLPTSAYSGLGSAYTQDGGDGPGGDWEQLKPGRATFSGKDCIILIRRS